MSIVLGGRGVKEFFAKVVAVVDEDRGKSTGIRSRASIALYLRPALLWLAGCRLRCLAGNWWSDKSTRLAAVSQSIADHTLFPDPT